jgi:thiamine-phosphate pyrophosphorylase
MNHYSLVGIGGIDENTIQAVAQTGVGSVAVVRAITGSDDPEAAVQRLTQLMMQAKNK